MEKGLDYTKKGRGIPFKNIFYLVEKGYAEGDVVGGSGRELEYCIKENFDPSCRVPGHGLYIWDREMRNELQLWFELHPKPNLIGPNVASFGLFCQTIPKNETDKPFRQNDFRPIAFVGFCLAYAEFLGRPVDTIDENYDKGISILFDKITKLLKTNTNPVDAIMNIWSGRVHALRHGFNQIEIPADFRGHNKEGELIRYHVLFHKPKTALMIR